MTTPHITIDEIQPAVVVQLGSASCHPMQTLRFPLIKCDEVAYVLFEDHDQAKDLLGDWYGIEPTEAYDSPDGNNMVELKYLWACAIIAKSPNGEIEWDDWIAGFEPIERSAGQEGDYMFALSGPEAEQVKAAFDVDPCTVWTVLDSDGELTIAGGLHRVNRTGYMITKRAEGRTPAHVFCKNERNA